MEFYEVRFVTGAPYIRVIEAKSDQEAAENYLDLLAERYDWDLEGEKIKAKRITLKTTPALHFHGPHYNQVGNQCFLREIEQKGLEAFVTKSMRECAELGALLDREEAEEYCLNWLREIAEGLTCLLIKEKSLAYNRKVAKPRKLTSR